MFRKLFLLGILLGWLSFSYSQKDSLVFSDGSYLVGEIKVMNKGVITVETDYSDSDFKAEWKKLREIYTATHCLVTLSNGLRFEGQLQSVNSDEVRLYAPAEELLVNRRSIVHLQTISEGFASRFDAYIALGYSFTKAENLRQVTLRSNLGYKAERWQIKGTYNDLTSTQRQTEPIRRRDGQVFLNYFLPNDWYLIPEFTFLSNTEQNLNFRGTTKFGVGKLVVHNNRALWGFTTGINYNFENFARRDTLESPPRRFNEIVNSSELFFGSSVDIFDVKDFSLLSSLSAYPSLTIRNRWRVDFNVDLKYDLPLDFFIQLGLTLNFDNQADNRTDYVVQSTFGWDW